MSINYKHECEELERRIESLLEENSALAGRAENAERERDDLALDRIKTWENGYLNGREDTLSEYADKENALRAKHWREAAEALDSKYGRYDIMGWEGAEYIEELADTIERGDS